MKYAGIFLFVGGLLWAYLWRFDPVEGKVMRPVGLFGAAVGFFLLIEGMQSEIIAEVDRKIAKRMNEIRFEIKQISHLIALYSTTHEEGIREEIRNSLKIHPVQSETKPPDTEDRDA
jgi:hypothetical protein